MRAASKCLLVILVTTSCTALAAAAVTDPNPVEFNPFTKSYVSRIPAPASADQPPKIFAGTDRVGDYYRLLEDGYDMLGYSSFKFSSAPPAKLNEQATRLNADVVLVYTQGVGRLVSRPEPPSGAGDKSAPGRDGTLYEYFATYWTKLPTPLLGLHVQRAGQDDHAGLEVLAVIKQSPAAASGLQRGDVLLSIGEVELRQPEQLVQAAQRYSGQVVEVVGRRDGGDFRKTVTLNRR